MPLPRRRERRFSVGSGSILGDLEVLGRDSRLSGMTSSNARLRFPRSLGVQIRGLSMEGEVSKGSFADDLRSGLSIRAVAGGLPVATISAEETWVHTRLDPGRFTSKGNWCTSLLIVNLFRFPCMQKSRGAILPRYLE